MSKDTFVILKKMDNKEFRVLMEHLLMGKSDIEPKNWLDDCYTHQAMESLKEGLRNSVLAICVLKTICAQWMPKK